jgi:pseudouridine synthase
MQERLQKVMAHAGIGSRRHCEELIRKGRVSVNGTAAHIGQSVDPRKDTVLVNGKPISREEHRYIMVYKPRDVISSTEDELDEGRRTVRDLVDVPGHLYPVGRLDKNSLGLMLLTNDGDMAHKLTHPSFGHKKTYLVWVEGKPTRLALDAWRKGVDLDGQMTLPCKVKVVEEEETRTRLQIVMREGRKRQIRRVATQLGYPVQNLLRIKLGPLHLSDIGLGKWRDLTPDEVRQLRRAVKNSEKRRDATQQYSGKRRQNRPKHKHHNPHKTNRSHRSNK